MKEEIIKKLSEYHKEQGIAFISEADALDYFKGLVELIENLVDDEIEEIPQFKGTLKELDNIHL